MNYCIEDMGLFAALHACRLMPPVKISSSFLACTVLFLVFSCMHALPM